MSEPKAAVAAAPAEKKKSNGGKILLAVIGLLIIGAIANSLSDSTPSRTTTATRSSSAATTTVRYDVTGTASRVSLTLENDTSGTEHHDSVAVPWSKTWRGFSNGDFVYLPAQNQGETGTLTCIVNVNNRKVFSGDASGRIRSVQHQGQ